MCVYGHSHVEHVCTVGGVLCANPGSATLPHNMNAELVSRTNIPELRCFCVAVKASGMFVCGQGTIGFLEIEGGEASVTIWQLTEAGVEEFDWLRWSRKRR